MRTKLFKRLGACVLACMMVFGASTSVFAAEMENSNEVTIAGSASDENVVPLADTAVTGTVLPWNSTTLWPHLSSYIGFSKTIRITTQSSGGNGGVDIELVKDGNLKSDGNWLMGVNDVGEWTLTLPSSGNYELRVHNKSDATIFVIAQWL